ncbi:hypothetical protein [Aurantiacibacter sp. MUD61]|uniref:hypothetical protein n=1 Tax=Aurantiacibacter sp. MUD61 TaxID=3009083 RepID=UPI0022F093A8|nr:hypothetical protein [Aurantiacibacter sp. MUD61]
MTIRRTLRRAAATACAASLFTATVAYAQDTIVVEGARIETADIRSTARDITSGANAMFQPLARFQRPVCPGVYGLSEVNAQAVVDRIAANAIAAGIDVNEEPGCGANVWVVVVDDVAATFDNLVEEDSFMTRHLTPFQLRSVRSQEGDARGWNLITSRNPETGLALPDGFERAQAAYEAQQTGNPPPVNQINNMSRLELAVRSDIELSVLLVERSAMADLDVGALADYATMRLFASTETPSGDSPVSTVLTLFDPEEGDYAPRQMTAFDKAYLAALYRSSPTRPARLAMGGIEDLMEQIGDAED